MKLFSVSREMPSGAVMKTGYMSPEWNLLGGGMPLKGLNVAMCWSRRLGWEERRARTLRSHTPPQRTDSFRSWLPR